MEQNWRPSSREEAKDFIFFLVEYCFERGIFEENSIIDPPDAVEALIVVVKNIFAVSITVVDVTKTTVGEIIDSFAQKLGLE